MSTTLLIELPEDDGMERVTWHPWTRANTANLSTELLEQYRRNALLKAQRFQQDANTLEQIIAERRARC